MNQPVKDRFLDVADRVSYLLFVFGVAYLAYLCYSVCVYVATRPAVHP